jgi:hypothetical protein
VEVTKKSSPTKSSAKKTEDSIADDVRKIKESMKKEAKPAPARKSRGGRPRKVEEVVEEKKEPAPKPVNELKNELLADWLDDDDVVDEPAPPPQPPKSAEKVGESSRSIRNIPKKQRVSEVYIQPVEEAPVKKTNKRKRTSSDVVNEPEPKKMSEDENLLMATAELLNVTEVPKVEPTTATATTFHNTNDIDKRNLPPKERNKRMFRQKNSRESNENGKEAAEPMSEVMLPHKKKQSSRILTPTEKISETRNVQRKKRKSSSEVKEVEAKPVSPLREAAEDESTTTTRRKLSKDVKVEAEPKIVVACASESICITSKGELSVASRDSTVTTTANSVMVTSQVIISEATRQPIVSTATSTETSVCSPKPTIKIPLKNALKIPAEKLLEMKKQGLVTTGNDMKNKLTEQGKQIFKEFTETKEKIAELESVVKAPEVPEVPEPIKEDVEEVKETEKEVVEPEPEVTTAAVEPDESTNNNETKDEPVENGKETSEADSTDGSSGLIALLAETFGGPPNCFYLCRQIEDRYEPVDSQILVLNAQNALVPYEGDDPAAPADVVSENLAGYPQMSPNSNIIINTPNGQKIELNHYAIMALQEQADENGVAQIELSGEQLELNINAILEAISAQQEANDGDTLLPTMLIDGDGALILDPTEMPVEVNHSSATQVSETLSKPIMSTTVAPEIGAMKAAISETVSKNLNIEDSLASIGVTTQPTRSNVPKSLELPITVTNPTIAGEFLARFC